MGGRGGWPAAGAARESGLVGGRGGGTRPARAVTRPPWRPRGAACWGACQQSRWWLSVRHTGLSSPPGAPHGRRRGRVASWRDGRLAALARWAGAVGGRGGAGPPCPSRRGGPAASRAAANPPGRPAGSGPAGTHRGVGATLPSLCSFCTHCVQCSAVHPPTSWFLGGATADAARPRRGKGRRGGGGRLGGLFVAGLTGPARGAPRHDGLGTHRSPRPLPSWAAAAPAHGRAGSGHGLVSPPRLPLHGARRALQLEERAQR